MPPFKATTVFNHVFFIFLWRAELENTFFTHWHRFCAQFRIIVMHNSNRSHEAKSDAKYRRNWEKKFGFPFMINIPGGLLFLG